MEKELQNMYDSEINVQIVSIWDGGWRVSVGSIHDPKLPVWDFCEVNEIIPALQELIKEHYPDSTYAKSLSSPSKEE